MKPCTERLFLPKKKRQKQTDKYIYVIANAYYQVIGGTTISKAGFHILKAK